MSNESFNWKSLFVNDDANQTSENPSKEQAKTISISENKFPDISINSGNSSNISGGNSTILF